MNGLQSGALRSFRRVREFMQEHAPADVPASFERQVSELDAVIASMAELAHEQDLVVRIGRGETNRQKALRQALWTSHMVPVARIAREVFDIPGVEPALRLPPMSADNDRLLAAARGMADAAERHRGVFTDHGMPEQFVEALRGAADMLSEALLARVESGRRRVTANAAVAAQVRRGRRAVRVLNAILAPRFAVNEELKAAWDVARRLRDPGNPRSTPAGVVVEPAPVVKVA